MALTSTQAVPSWSSLSLCRETFVQSRGSASFFRLVPCHLHAKSSVRALSPDKSVTAHHMWAACEPTRLASRLAGGLSPRTGVLRGGRAVRSVRVRAAEDDDLPPELQELNDEDGKFAKINQGDPAYGPPALLLFGFTPEEKQDVKGLLDEIGGDFMKIVQATDDMLDGTLWDAFGRVQVQNPPNLAAEVPRMCFISGLTGEELMMLVDAFGKSKLRRPVFAALVPKNKDKLLRELIDEVMGDHRRLVIEGRQRLREAQAQAKATG